MKKKDTRVLFYTTMLNPKKRWYNNEPLTIRKPQFLKVNKQGYVVIVDEDK